MELHPELVWQAKRLRRGSPKGHQRSLRAVLAALFEMGFSWHRAKAMVEA